jgi:hypothetical protein
MNQGVGHFQRRQLGITSRFDPDVLQDVVCQWRTAQGNQGHAKQSRRHPTRHRWLVGLTRHESGLGCGGGQRDRLSLESPASFHTFRPHEDQVLGGDPGSTSTTKIGLLYSMSQHLPWSRSVSVRMVSDLTAVEEP